MSDDRIVLHYETTREMRRRAIVETSKRLSLGGGGAGGTTVQLIGGIVTALIVGVLSAVVLPERNPGVTVLIFGGGFWACLLLWHVSYKRQLAKLEALSGPSAAEPTVFEAGPEGIVIAGAEGRSQLKWSAVQDIAVRDDLIMLLIRTNALAIPAAALHEDVTVDRMIDTMNRWRKAKG